MRAIGTGAARSSDSRRDGVVIRQHRRVQVHLTELAEILARGFLRLTQNPRDRAVSGREIPEKDLDVRAVESVHVCVNNHHRGT